MTALAAAKLVPVRITVVPPAVVPVARSRAVTAGAEAVTQLYVPGIALAVGRVGAEAEPSEAIVTVALLKVAEAPVARGSRAKVTTPPATGAPKGLETLTLNGVAKVLLT